MICMRCAERGFDLVQARCLTIVSPRLVLITPRANRFNGIDVIVLGQFDSLFAPGRCVLA